MIFGVILESDNGTEFRLITGNDELEITGYLNNQGFADFEVVDAEDLINSQYGGMTVLTTD